MAPMPLQRTWSSVDEHDVVPSFLLVDDEGGRARLQTGHSDWTRDTTTTDAPRRRLC
jgi:hypothetical protein